jgi:hypothetical protein
LGQVLIGSRSVLRLEAILALLLARDVSDDRVGLRGEDTLQGVMVQCASLDQRASQ